MEIYHIYIDYKTIKILQLYSTVHSHSDRYYSHLLYNIVIHARYPHSILKIVNSTLDIVSEHN